MPRLMTDAGALARARRRNRLETAATLGVLVLLAGGRPARGGR